MFYIVLAVCVQCLRNKRQGCRVANWIFAISCTNPPLPPMKSDADGKIML